MRRRPRVEDREDLRKDGRPWMTIKHNQFRDCNRGNQDPKLGRTLFIRLQPYFYYFTRWLAG